MPTLIDKAGNRYDFMTLDVHGDSVSLDGARFIQGAMADFTVDYGKAPKVTPPTFRMLFSSPERIAIKALVNGDASATPPVEIDPIVEDWWVIVTDPQLTEVDLGLASVQLALGYLVALGVLTEERKAEILTGKLQ